MPRKPLPWFRFYCEALRDPKLRRIPPEERWVWVAAMAMARESPESGRLLIADGLPATIADIADEANVTVKAARSAVAHFIAFGMISLDGDVYVLPNFKERQFESDNVTERTAKHRSKERRRNVPTSDEGTELPSVCTDYRQQREDSDADASSSSAPSADDDDPVFTEALRQLAVRKLTAELRRGSTITHRHAWRAATIANDRADFAATRADFPNATVNDLLALFEVGPELAAERAAAREREVQVQARVEATRRELEAAP